VTGPLACPAGWVNVKPNSALRALCKTFHIVASTSMPFRGDSISHQTPDLMAGLAGERKSPGEFRSSARFAQEYLKSL
jgi:hypothetical protein